MEILITAVILYVAYRCFKSTAVSKTAVATEIQTSLRQIEGQGWISYDGNMITDVQGYVGNMWESVKKTQENLHRPQKSPHRLFLATYISSRVAEFLNELEQSNQEIFLMCATNLVQRAQMFALSNPHKINPIDLFLMNRSVEIIEQIMQKTSSPLDKNIEKLLENN